MSDRTVSPLRVSLLGVGLVAVGTVGFFTIPGMIADDSDGSAFVNAFYCAVITLTTIGYGDICPSNPGHLGRIFLVLLAFTGLGMFCGPVMDLGASWKNHFPGGTIALIATCMALGVFVFSSLLQEMSEFEAMYFSIITGTTIGYGDLSPKSDVGKIAVALYAILAVNVVGGLLEPARDRMLELCYVPKKKSEKYSKAAEAAKKQRREHNDEDSAEKEKTI